MRFSTLEIFVKNHRVACVWATTVLLTVSFLIEGLFFFAPIGGWDVLVRYAPMAEAFAAGDWVDAYHPRFCVLFQVLTGTTVKLLGVSGLQACQIVAILFWGFSFPALWAVLRRVFGDLTAYIGALFLFLSVDLFLYAADGWRDDCRILPILLMVLAFRYLLSSDAKERTLKASLAMAAAQVLSITLRVDCLPISTIILGAFVVAALVRRNVIVLIAPVLAWVLSVGVVCGAVYWRTGWFVPSPRYIRLIEGMLS